MKKRGFTLQELLITIAIIGIVAAICAPAIVGIIPDRNKATYVKVYNILANMTEEILNDPSLYWTTYNNQGEPNCAGMACDRAPTVPPYNVDNDFSTQSKFPMILSTHLNLAGEVENSPGDVSFTTLDGVLWQFNVRLGVDNNVPGNGVFLTDLTINIEPNRNNNCSYSAECTNPNEFLFEIDNDGRIQAADALGIVYLQNPTDLNSAREDKALAAEVISTANSDSDIEAMNQALKDIKSKALSAD